MKVIFLVFFLFVFVHYLLGNTAELEEEVPHQRALAAIHVT